nr:TetR/AcrR family transcriptional regulator [Propionibacterium sp.]
MTMQSVRPRGRRPGHDDTRGAIAAAALALFDELGYDGASLRAIARDAAVDPALVHHYFSSKAHLFTSVLVHPDLDLVARFEQAAEGDSDTLGHRLAKAFFDLWEHPQHRARLIAFLQERTLARRRLLAEFLGREVFGRLASRLGHGNALLRGQLAASTLIGLMAGRHVLELGALSTASARSLVEPVGRSLQHYLVDAW